jgi:DNA-binding GntR family transcriptional regulator
VAEVSNLLGVSRTPAREALLQLAREGLIEFERSVGFRVQRRTFADIAEIFHMRLLLECPAVQTTAAVGDAASIAKMRTALKEMVEAADDGDPDALMAADLRFHEAALEPATNKRLVEAVQRLRDATASLGAPVSREEWSLRDIAEEHRPILQAVEAGDVEAAGLATRRHIAHAAILLLGWSEAPPPESSDNRLVRHLWEVFRSDRQNAAMGGPTCAALTPAAT